MVAGQAIIVMGVTGAGKSTVGALLAAELGCNFLDADNFHSDENKAKMKHGVPLTDEDRMPWLETLRDTLIDYIVREQRVVLACSALLPKYRDLLRTADYEWTGAAEAGSIGSEPKPKVGREAALEERSVASHVVFVYLKCPAEVLAPRVIAREMGGKHYMPASLLQSQINALTLEPSERDIVEVDASVAPALIVQSIRSQLAL